MTYVGQSLKRKEDHRLLTGRGRFVGDVRAVGMVEAAVLRSTRAHAKIRGVNAGQARALPGVLAVFTAQEVEGKIKPQFRLFWEETLEEQRQTFGPRIKRFRRPALARDAVYRAGEPLAIVVARDRYLAEDALDLIEVDYEPMPVLADPEAALRPEAPVLGPELQAPALGEGLPANAQADFCIGTGDVERALREADGTFTARFRLRRQVGSPIETRGVVAAWEADRRQLTIWATTQLPHMLRASLSNLLDLPQEAIQILGSDMGGSFGGGIWNEDILIPFIAMELRRPVRWIEDRAENLVNARHSRDQVHTVEVAYAKDGRITGLRDRIVLDVGVYSSSPLTCFYNTATHLRGQYRVENFRVEAIAVLTNKTANTPVRGAGRQEAAFVMDRVLEGVALRLGMDPAEVRRRNLIRAEAIPYDNGIYYRDGKRIIYESADFPAQLAQALDLAEYRKFRAQQAARRAEGRRIGIGVSSYVEGTGAGPHEGAAVR
ncbi:MAG TPA: xanthine dehydrogenase family protein molybdopterin-binding subunit, partial [Candidatus Methylomirabilis sp.]